MTTGLSGTYAVNTTQLSLQPTEGRWGERQEFGFDGLGHPIYSAVATFELRWQLISPSDLSQIVGFFNAVQNTGTVAVDLPKWGDSQYSFYRYSGCTLSQVRVGEFFNEYYTDARLLILNVRV